MMRSKPYDILIIGGNFAGLTAAGVFSGKLRVRVIDPTPWFEFLPAVHELISGIKTPEMLRLSKRAILNRMGHELIADTVRLVDAEKNLVLTESGQQISFDFCVIATGGENNTFGVKGADVHAWPFKTVNDCRRIGEQLSTLASFEKKFSIVIVGGGLEGIESLGEILKKYGNHSGIQIHVVEAHHRLLADAPADVDAVLRHHCARFPVHFHANVSVKRVWKHSVDLSNGIKLPSQMTIWTGGARPSPLLYHSGLSNGPEQWGDVKQTLQSRHYENIFIAGDAAGLDHPVSKQAYHALDMGKCAGKNILRLIAGKSLYEFKPSAKPKLISFGDLDAFMVTENSVLAGTALNSLKEAVYQLIMAQFDPSGIFLKTYHAVGRAVTAAFDIALPMLFSPSSLKRLTDIRILH